jgi:hypothetical protein
MKSRTRCGPGCSRERDRVDGDQRSRMKHPPAVRSRSMAAMAQAFYCRMAGALLLPDVNWSRAT